MTSRSRGQTLPSAERDHPGLRALRSSQGSAEILVLRGELDLLTSRAFAQALQSACDAGSAAIVVDLGHISFIDSTGLSVLLDARRSLSSEHRRLALACAPDGIVHKLLSMTGLLDKFAVYGSLRGALAGGQSCSLASSDGARQST